MLGTLVSATPSAAQALPVLHRLRPADECSGRPGAFSCALPIPLLHSNSPQPALRLSALGFAFSIPHMLRRAAPRLLGRLLAIEGGLLAVEAKAALLPAAARSVQQNVSAAAAARGFRSSSAFSYSLAEALR